MDQTSLTVKSGSYVTIFTVFLNQKLYTKNNGPVLFKIVTLHRKTYVKRFSVKRVKALDIR